ncbi:MAG: RNA-binding protein [Oscillospiraceae bacterium]|nr:RNA-binding protein [Oscillospiraceae bacterium]MBQ4310125.1 RNA-binding protein [Oscillospiraceae bacterium]
MRKFPGISTALSDEEAILLSHISDMAEDSSRTNRQRFSQFLDERQAMLAESMLSAGRTALFRFFGGYEGAHRVMLCVYPDEYSEPENSDFPMKAVTYTYRKQDKPTHSQFLGTLMSRGITRATVGDIIVSEGRTVVFVCESAVRDAEDIGRVARIGVTSSVSDSADISSADSFEEIKTVVSSPRLDCIVSAVSGLSREKAAALIKGEGAEVNYCQVCSPDVRLKDGDIFSVRGKGKYIFDGIGGTTKKNRIYITLRKYR